MFSDLSPEDFTQEVKDPLKAHRQHIRMTLKDVYILLGGVTVAAEPFCRD